MNGSEAVLALMNGYKITRDTWLKGDYLEMTQDGHIVDEKGEDYLINILDDYEIYVEKEWRWKYACLYDGEMVVSVDYMTASEAEERGYGEDNKLKFTAKEFTK